jgi:putative alpha-1,2-mannosidase
MLPTTTPIGPRPWYAWETTAHDDTEVGVPGYEVVCQESAGLERVL